MKRKLSPEVFEGLREIAKGYLLRHHHPGLRDAQAIFASRCQALVGLSVDATEEQREESTEALELAWEEVRAYTRAYLGDALPTLFQNKKAPSSLLS